MERLRQADSLLEGSRLAVRGRQSVADRKGREEKHETLMLRQSPWFFGAVVLLGLFREGSRQTKTLLQRNRKGRPSHGQEPLPSSVKDTTMKNINNLNTNNSDDSAQKNNDFDEIYNKLLYTRICFAIRFKDKNKINRELWWIFYYSNGLNVNNFVKKEPDRKYPGEYVYIFKLSNNFSK
jgi:hypothetical protein